MWETIFDTNQWSEGIYTTEFEKTWTGWNDAQSLAFSGWTGAALAILDYIDVNGSNVLCPSNTFMATPLATVKSGGNVKFVDCNRNDLCMSFDDFKEKAELYKPKAAWIVHIGGHIAFEIEKISKYCYENNIFLIEDCAHSHGAEWNGKKPGTWGIAGVYSMYATKTISTGEGGMLVSENRDLLDSAIRFRNYGKPDYKSVGLNYRMSEFTAALGVVQARRMSDIISWKNKYARKYLDPIYKNRVVLPKGMISGYYKYIVFEEIVRSTGKVYDTPCHKIMDYKDKLENTDWVSKNHWCVPIYYHPELEI
jgi:dTDP-4-amino-4,6-dideoxygalactose transaminase